MKLLLIYGLGYNRLKNIPFFSSFIYIFSLSLSLLFFLYVLFTEKSEMKLFFRFYNCLLIYSLVNNKIKQLHFSLFIFIVLFLILSLFFSLSLSLFLTFSFSLFFYIFPSHSFSHSFSLSFFLSLSLSIYLSLSYLFYSLSFSYSLFISLSFPSPNLFVLFIYGRN